MKKIIILLFLISVFLIGFLPAVDSDFGWHYRCGEEFLTRGALCVNNNFSYFLPNYKFYYSSFLYDVGLAFIFDRFGFLGVSVVCGLVFAVAGAAFVGRREREDREGREGRDGREGLVELFLKMMAFFLVIFFSWQILQYGLRAQVVSWMLLLVLLSMISQVGQARGVRQGAGLIFIFFLWVNIHSGFFIGFIVLWFWWLTANRKTEFIKRAWVIFLCFLATLLNPFGQNVYLEIDRHLMSPLNTMIAEWLPPSSGHILLIWGLLLVFMVAVSIKIFRFHKAPRLEILSFLFLLFFAVLALTARRNLPLFYAVFFYLLLRDTDIKSLISKIKIQIYNPNLILIALLIAGIFVLILVQVSHTVAFATSWEKYCTEGMVEYPCAVDYPLRGNVFATYEWGGFLIWRQPHIKVFVDGRMPAWQDEDGKSPYEVFLEIVQARQAWNDTLRKWKTDNIFINKGTFLGLKLEKNSAKFGWKKVYEKGVYVIYKKII